MAKESLFPVFDVPEVVTTTAVKERRYNPSVYFDFEEGDFRRDGAGKVVEADGREAYEQWCLKAAMTERFTCLSYTNDIGTEMVDALSQADRAATESAIERTISEALMVNPRTEYVRNFSFEWNADSLKCNFTVKGQDLEEAPLTVDIPT